MKATIKKNAGFDIERGNAVFIDVDDKVYPIPRGFIPHGGLWFIAAKDYAKDETIEFDPASFQAKQS